MKWKVEKYNPVERFHLCTPADGNEHLGSHLTTNQRFDLLVNGDLPEGTDPEGLVGKIVEIDSSHSYIAIAYGVRIVPEPEEDR